MEKKETTGNRRRGNKRGNRGKRRERRAPAEWGRKKRGEGERDKGKEGELGDEGKEVLKGTDLIIRMEIE